MPAEKPSVLVVDDELNICRTCVKILSKMDLSVQYTLNGYDALKCMSTARFDVVITDLKMSSMGGMELLRRINEVHRETLVIVITGYSTVSSAVEVMKMGAFDYLPKPFTPNELRAVVMQALMERESRSQNQRLRKMENRHRPVAHRLVGSSRQIKKVILMVGKVAPTDSTVLLYGESGTGKELVARAVHANSKRRDKVFFAVDCGTLSGNLLESALFGHKKGSFTGAHRDKEGIFKRADGGTVFLDEISNISLEVQGKLLRFMEAREFIPVGGSRHDKVDLRLIFATNKNLEELVAKGLFREDFYYRIYVYPVIIPPLRDRRDDILPIAYHFLQQFSQNMGKSVESFSDDAAIRLKNFDWPGNVRQLKNVIERGLILSEREVMTLKELPVFGEMGDIEQLMDHVPETNEELKKIKKEIRQKAVGKIESHFVLKALTNSNWNITQAARAVGMQRTNFQALMKKYGVKRPKTIPPENGMS